MDLRRQRRRAGVTTPAEDPPRRVGSPAAMTRPCGRNSRPAATPIVGGIVIVGSSGEVLLIANVCPYDFNRGVVGS